jgi:flagellar biosynthesis protein FliQ
MYNLPPPDVSGSWVFASTFFNFAWPYVAIALAVLAAALVIGIVIAIFRSLWSPDDY